MDRALLFRSPSLLLLAVLFWASPLGTAARAPQAVGMTPCTNGFAGPYPCANVDLMAFIPHSAMGGAMITGNDIWGWTDPLTSREYALVGESNGTAFVDVTVPDQPLFLGSLPTHSGNSLWRDVEVHADHAFIVADNAGNHGMQVFDLRQLRNAVNPPVTFTETAHYSGFATAHTLAINVQTGFAYAAGSDTCSGGPHMVNVQNPAAPVMAGCVANDGYTHETQCVTYQGPDATHAGREICFSSNEDTLTIVDVTNKSAPAQISRTTYSGSGYTHQGWLTPDHRHFLLDDELDELLFGTPTRTHIWDVSDLDAPQRFAIYEAAVRSIDHNQYINGNFAYQANYTSGLRILELSGIAQGLLREAAYFDIFPRDDAAVFDAAWSNYPFFPSGTVVVNGIGFVAGQGDGLFVLRPNLSGNPMGLPNFQTSAAPESATVAGGQLATFTLTLTPQNNFSGTITFACGPFPVSVSCAFSPSSLTLAGAPASTTLTLRTTSSSAPPADNASSHLPGLSGGALLARPEPASAGQKAALLLVAFLLAPLAARKKKRPLWLPSLLLLVCLASGLAACGGDLLSRRTIIPDPRFCLIPEGCGPFRGTHTINVISTSGSLRHFTTLSLTVQ